MNTETMQLLSALLALFAVGGTLVLLVARLLSGRSVSAANFVLAFRPVALPLAFMVAGFAMFGSLWFSEAANYNPCKLCWYQRICMYSIAIISFVAAIRKDNNIARYTIVLAPIGLLVATYHYLLEWFPTLESNVCSLDVPCTSVWFRELGFVTLCFMAGCAFIAVIAISLAIIREQVSTTTSQEQ